MTPIRSTTYATALSVLTACASSGGAPGAAGGGQVTRLNQVAPPGAEPGTCWGKIVTPAIIETITQQVVLKPAQAETDDNAAQPALYITETRQEIVRERNETWFLTPCAADMTPEFIASVQRALAVRGLYRGEISGEMTPATRTAVRRYQKPLGLDSTILSTVAARKLGLVAVERNATG